MKSFQKSVNRMNIINIIAISLPIVLGTIGIYTYNYYTQGESKNYTIEETRTNIDIHCYTDNCKIKLDPNMLTEGDYEKKIIVTYKDKISIDLNIDNKNLNYSFEKKDFKFLYTPIANNKYFSEEEKNKLDPMLKNISIETKEHTFEFDHFVQKNLVYLGLFLTGIYILRKRYKSLDKLSSNFIKSIDDEKEYSNSIDKIIISLNYFDKTSKLLNIYKNNEKIADDLPNYLDKRYKEQNNKLLMAINKYGIFNKDEKDNISSNFLNNLNNYLINLPKEEYLNSINILRSNQNINAYLLKELMKPITDHNILKVIKNTDLFIDVIRNNNINKNNLLDKDFLSYIKNILDHEKTDIFDKKNIAIYKKQKQILINELNNYLPDVIKKQIPMLSNRLLSLSEEVENIKNNMNNIVYENLNELVLFRKNSNLNNERYDDFNHIINNIEKELKYLNIIKEKIPEYPNIEKQFNTIINDVNELLKTYDYYSADEQKKYIDLALNNLNMFNEKIYLMANESKDGLKKNLNINKNILYKSAGK